MRSQIVHDITLSVKVSQKMKHQIYDFLFYDINETPPIMRYHSNRYHRYQCRNNTKLEV
jgi:hypothetical protein